MKCTYLCLVIVLLSAVMVDASHSEPRTIELTLCPAKAAEAVEKYTLLPKAEVQTEADAVPLYQKAIQLMPKDFSSKQLQEWFKLPVEELPQEQAEEVLQKCMDSLKLVAQAARCKQCNWPEWKPGAQPVDLSKYRELVNVLRLWARLEISRREYNGAIAAMQTGFGMARHLGQAPTIVQALVGVANGAIMCKEVEQFVQTDVSPNLYWALANLPRPFIDVEMAIENERGHLKDRNLLVRNQLENQLGPAHDKVRMIAKRFDNDLNALQCVEAVRHYAATHDGRLPEVLSDVSDIEVPKDVVSGETFIYRRTTAGAVLQSAVPEGGSERDAIRYEIVLKK